MRGMWRRACVGDRLDRLMLVLLQLSLVAGSLIDGSALWNWRAGSLIAVSVGTVPSVAFCCACWRWNRVIRRETDRGVGHLELWLRTQGGGRRL